MLDKNTNLTHQSKIEFVNSNLRGIGFVNNTKIEVPYSLPGDVYNVTFFKKKRRKPSAKLELVSQTQRSFIPPCSAFTKCGGCCAQHISYQDQFRYKTSSLLESYKKRF